MKGLSGNSLRLTINFPLFPAASILYLQSEVTLTKVSFFYWILSSLAVTGSSGSSYARWAEATFSPWGLCLGVTQSWVPPQASFTPCSFQDASCRDMQPHQAARALHAFPFVLVKNWDSIAAATAAASLEHSTWKWFVHHRLRAPDKEQDEVRGESCFRDSIDSWVYFAAVGPGSCWKQ